MALFIYFVVLVSLTAMILVLTRNTRVFPSVVAAAVSYWVFMAAGTYHIFISRGSTAGIGFLFIPVYSLLPAFVGGAGVAFARQPAIGYKILGGLVLTAWLPMVGFTLQGISRNPANQRRTGCPGEVSTRGVFEVSKAASGTTGAVYRANVAGVTRDPTRSGLFAGGGIRVIG